MFNYSEFLLAKKIIHETEMNQSNFRKKNIKFLKFVKVWFKNRRAKCRQQEKSKQGSKGGNNNSSGGSSSSSGNSGENHLLNHSNLDEDSSSLSPDDDSLIKENGGSEINNLSADLKDHSPSTSGNSTNQNSQILTPNSANSTTHQHHSNPHSGIQRQQQDTPPVSPNGQQQYTNLQRQSQYQNDSLGLFNVNQSIWSPAAVKFEPNTNQFNLNSNHHLITAAAAAVANISGAGSVTPSSSSSPPINCLPISLGQNNYGLNNGLSIAQSSTPPIYQNSTSNSSSNSSVTSYQNNTSSSSNNSSTNTLTNLNNSNQQQQQQQQQLLTPSSGQQHENYYNATNYLAPYHHQHLNPLSHHMSNQNSAQNHYRHLQAADYMQAADYNAIQRSSAASVAADMWAAHKFHGF